MSDVQTAPTLETLYEQHREQLYRAMVLATDDRDVSLEAVDRAFARSSRRALRKSAHPEATVMRRAVAFATKRSRREGMRGFRLPDADVASSTATIVEAIRRRPLDDRIAVIGDAYLGWERDAIATAVGRSDGAETEHLVASLATELELDPATADGRIAAALGEAGHALSRPLSRLESVKTEGRLHKLAVAAGSAAIVLVVIGGATLGLNAFRSTSGDDPGAPEVVAATGGTPGTAPGASTTAPPIGFESVTWVQAGLPFRQGDMSTATAGPDGFVAIGNDYSDPTGNGMRLMLSESGYDWAVVESPLPRNGWMQSLVYEGGRYIGVGSQFDEFGGGGDTPVVVVSEDGSSWEVLTIPVERSIEIEGTAIRVHTSVNTATANGDELLVIGTQHAEEDLFSLIQDSLPEDVAGTQNWGISARGIDFYDFQGNLIRTVTAEELGVSAELFSLMSSGRPVAWRSTDGGVSWEEEGIGAGFGPDAWLSQILTAGDAKLALVYGQFGGGVWSDAGGEWAPVDLGRGVSLTGLGRFDDSIVLAGSSAEGAQIWTSSDGTTWTDVESEALAGVTIERIVTSPHGVVAVSRRGGNAGIGPAIVETEEGFVVEIDSTGRHVVTDPDGNVVLELFGNEIQYGDEGGVVVLADPETGDVVVTIEQRAIDQAWDTVYRNLEGEAEFGPENVEWSLLVSRDARTWTRIDVADWGPGFYPNVAVLGADRILVTGWQETGVEGGMRIWVGELASG